MVTMEGEYRVMAFSQETEALIDAVDHAFWFGSVFHESLEESSPSHYDNDTWTTDSESDDLEWDTYTALTSAGVSSTPTFISEKDRCSISITIPRSAEFIECRTRGVVVKNVSVETIETFSKRVIHMEFQGAGASRLDNGNTKNDGNHGVINYSFYNTHYQNSMDLSDFGSTTSTGYGHDGGSTDVDHTTGNWTNTLTAGLSAIPSLLPLLADSKTEDIENSDRVDVDQAGTSTLLTQHTVGRMVYGPFPKQKMVTSAADKPSESIPAFDRFYTVSLGDWEATQAFGYMFVLPLPSGLLGQAGTVMRTMAQRHYIFRCGWDVQVQVNATRFHGGALGVFLVPEFTYQTTSSTFLNKRTIAVPTTPDINWNLRQFFLYPHQIINPRTNSSAQVMVPYANAAPGSDPTTHNPWTLVVMVISPLTYATGATTSLTITASVRPVDPTFHGLRLPNTDFEGPPVVQTHPASGQFATTQPFYSEPVYGKMVRSSVDFIPAKIEDYLQIARIPTLGTQISATFYNVPSPTPVITIDVSLSSVHILNTALGSIGRMFSQYRGSISVITMYVGNQMANVRYLLSYSPPGATTPTNVSEAMQGFYLIVDTGLNSQANFVIPYICPADYRYSASTVASDVSVGGYLTIFQLTALAVPPGSPATAQLLLFFAAGADFQFRGPSTPFITLQNGEEVLEPGETGVNAPADVSATVEDPQRIPFAPVGVSHSDVRFWWDRFFWVDTFYLDGSDNSEPWKRVRNIPLTPQFLFTRAPEMNYTRMATYWRAELEICIVPVLKTNPAQISQLTAVWYPPGSRIPTGTSTTYFSGGPEVMRAFTRNGACPLFHSDANGKLLFRIPFTSPLSTIPYTYNGLDRFSAATAVYNQAPGATFGTLVVSDAVVAGTSTNVQYKGGPYMMYIRFRDIELFCPRPGEYLAVKLPSDTTTTTALRVKSIISDPTSVQVSNGGITNKELLLQAGDVETNPGPIFSRLWKDMEKFVSDKACEGLFELKSMYKTLSTFQQMQALLTDDFKAKWLSRLFKAIGYGILACKASSDPSLAAAAVFLLGGSWTGQICVKMAKYLKGLMKTEPPPPPGMSEKLKKLIRQVSVPSMNPAVEAVEVASEAWHDTNPFKDCVEDWELQAPFPDVREMNNLFQLAKNAQWVLQGLNEIRDWLKQWMAQEENSPEEVFKQGLPNLEGFLQLYQTYKSQPGHPQWEECKQYFDKMRQAAAIAKPQMLRMLPLITRPEPSLARPEPILVVLRGRPGQGKSVAATFLAQTLSKTLVGKPSFYSMNSSTKYMDGYNQEPVVLVDDLGQATDGADFQHFCQLISIAPFQVNKADLADKGMLFTSSIIIATTNHPEFRPVTLADPEALRRRINFDFNVEAGRSYQDCNGCLDLQRAITPSEENPLPTLLRHGSPILRKECLSFTNLRTTGQVKSLKDVYEAVMVEHRRRQTCSMDFTNMFLEGPAECQGTEEKPVLPTLINQLTRTAGTNNLRPVTAEEIAKAIKECYQELGSPNDPPKWQQTMSALITVISFAIMLFSFFYLLSTIFFQGPYSDSAQKKEKKKAVAKLVDLSYEGPHAVNISMEAAIMKKNMVRVKCTRHDDVVFYTTGTFVRDRYMLMNWHLFEKCKLIQPDFEFPVEEVLALRPTFHGMPSDLVLLQFPNKGRAYRDITDLFINKGECNVTPGMTGKGLMMDEAPFMFDIQPVLFAEKISVQGLDIPQVLRYKAQTAPGFCGSLIVLDAGIHKRVVGIHCAGAHGVGAASVITKAGLIALLDSKFEGKISDVVEHPYVYTPAKTAFYPTIAHDENTTVAPAVLSPRDPRLTNPYQFKASIMEKHVGDMPHGPDVWVRAARVYARLLRAHIPADVTKRLTIGEAILGIPGLDPMDMDKSPGWPYVARNVRRPDLIKFKEHYQVELDQILYAEMVNYLSGDFRNHKFVTFLKDETRPIEKVAAGKTRVIDVASLGHAIVGRMLFGRLAAWMHSKNGVDIGSAVGCNPDLDWTRYAMEFKYKHFADVDYSGFDASHGTFSFHCLKVFLKELGFDEVAMAFVDSLAVSRHIWDDEEYTLTGGLPSGCACTSIFNTILNNIIMRGAISTLTTEPFQLLAYGDDLVICAYEKFDLAALRDFFSENSLYRITPATKGGELSWGELSDMRFLKRGFVLDGVIYRPQMTKENLHNILSWARAGTLQEKVLSVSLLAVHSGKQVYEELFESFNGTGVVVPSFATVDEDFYYTHASGQ
ncbi:polyprotein [malagasivirus A1]|uniref:Genome polyprotein n=10 Tax=malagasivirus A1 TaxID=1603963 RepID=A0A0B5GGD3_9PICO|nr:polyprotein [malagasivirus A1]AJF23125.1 polyprotein [malagasivirus A1]